MLSFKMVEIDLLICDGILSSLGVVQIKLYSFFLRVVKEER